MFLRNAEMAAMRELFDRTAGTGRLLNHTVVRPTIGEIDRMEEWRDTYRPVGWKVYTLGMMNESYERYDRGHRRGDSTTRSSACRSSSEARRRGRAARVRAQGRERHG